MALFCNCFFQTLSLPRSNTIDNDEIKRRYKQISKKCHPDKQQQENQIISTKAQQLITLSYNHLICSITREAYINRNYTPTGHYCTNNLEIINYIKTTLGLPKITILEQRIFQEIQPQPNFFKNPPPPPKPEQAKPKQNGPSEEELEYARLLREMKKKRREQKKEKVKPPQTPPGSPPPSQDYPPTPIPSPSPEPTPQTEKRKRGRPIKFPELKEYQTKDGTIIDSKFRTQGLQLMVEWTNKTKEWLHSELIIGNFPEMVKKYMETLRNTKSKKMVGFRKKNHPFLKLINE